eukprot:4198991-Pyramimonas_sp.AAC.1
MSRGSSGRSASNPLGRADYESVRLANQQASRVALLILISLVLHNAIVMVEQPVSSLLSEHPRWKIMKDLFGERFVAFNICMINFGGSSLKPTWLYSNSSKLRSLSSRPPVLAEGEAPETFRIIESQMTGKTQVEGGKGLKGTEAYPTEFGKAVADAHVDEITQNPEGD